MCRANQSTNRRQRALGHRCRYRVVRVCLKFNFVVVVAEAAAIVVAAAAAASNSLVGLQGIFGMLVPIYETLLKFVIELKCMRGFR